MWHPNSGLKSVLVASIGAHCFKIVNLWQNKHYQQSKLTFAALHNYVCGLVCFGCVSLLGYFRIPLVCIYRAFDFFSWYWKILKHTIWVTLSPWLSVNSFCWKKERSLYVHYLYTLSVIFVFSRILTTLFFSSFFCK